MGRHHAIGNFCHRVQFLKTVEVESRLQKFIVNLNEKKNNDEFLFIPNEKKIVDFQLVTFWNIEDLSRCCINTSLKELV